MKQPPAPFSCTYSPNLPEMLVQLDCTIALSTYQAGKVVLISANGPDELIQLPRNFTKAMGMAVAQDRLGVATKEEIIVLANSKGLAASYPPQTGTYDGLFVPRASYYCGEIDVHDMAWGEEGLYAVNTRFSCLSLIDDFFSFRPIWQPSFITDLTPNDRCHLNGLALHQGKPKYLTALGQSDTPKGWREDVTSAGLLIDYETKEIISNKLAMPHSPRYIDGKLYILMSATGELVIADLDNGGYEVVADLNGFVRGLAKHGDYLFVGLSRLRKNSSVFRDLPIAQKAISSGVVIIHLPTAAQVAHLQYNASVEEIYDVQVIPGVKRPGIMNTEKPEHRLALATPTDSFWKVDEPEEGQEKAQKPLS